MYEIYDEDISVVVSDNDMEVIAKLHEAGIVRRDLTVDDIIKKLRVADIVHGVDESAIEKLLKVKAYEQPFIIAKATPPDNGIDGKLIFHFSTDERTGRPKEISGGRVDYRMLDTYVPVTTGQHLLTRTLATPGKPGKTVKGTIIKQRQGKEAILPRSKNVTINHERTEMHAMCSGMVEYINNTVVVSNVYSIKGDCDLSVGNIDFDGSVHITGSVRPGHTIKATNGITIGGGVEASTLIAGGSVDIKGGMQGASKGRIEAGGNVSLLYVERGTISAAGAVKVDVSIHSKIESGSKIMALGKRGAIIGGQACASGDIIANYIGALSHVRTELEVGFMPRKRARVALLNEELKRLDADRLKLKQLDVYLNKSKDTMDGQTWDKLFRSGVENKRINEAETTGVNAEMSALQYEMEHATESKVHVYETAFGGSRIVIGPSVYKVSDDTSYVTFRYDDGKVVFGSCELSKNDRRK